MSKFIPKELNPMNWFMPEIPQQVAPAPVAPIPPPAPAAAVTPPPAGSTTEYKKSEAELSKRGGFRSNLFSGGLGLKTINQANLSKRKLGLN